jgi:hypothetical protein
LAFYHFKYGLKTIVPSNNLMKNIGFDAQGTHTTSPNLRISKLELGFMEGPYKENFDKSFTSKIDEYYESLFMRNNIIIRAANKIYALLKLKD